MSHEIGLLDQVVTNTGTERAWHLKDRQVELNGISSSELATRTGLDYQVDIVPLQRSDNNKILVNHYGVFAEGNENVLQIVSDRFSPVQPASFIDWVHGCNDALGSQIVSAGTIRERSYGFASIDLCRDYVVGADDALRKYITFTISWDGKYPISCVAMDYRTVCANTYPSIEYIDALGENGCLYYQKKHGKLNGAAIQAVVEKVLNIGKVNAEKSKEILGRLVDTKYDSENTRLINRFASVMADGKAIIDRIVDMGDNSKSFLDSCLNATIDQEAWNKVKTAGMSNHANRIVAETMDGLGADMETAKGSLWGMLNGFTYWTDHLSGRESNKEGRQEAVTFGKYSTEKKNAILLLSAIANTPSLR